MMTVMKMNMKMKKKIMMMMMMIMIMILVVVVMMMMKMMGDWMIGVGLGWYSWDGSRSGCLLWTVACSDDVWVTWTQDMIW